MVRHRRSPSVQHGGNADSRAEMPGIGGDRQHGLRCRLEQQVVDDRLVLESDVGELGRQREHDMEVADWKQVCLAVGKPCPRSRTLALRTMPITAGIVGDTPLAAVLTGFDMTAKGCGAAVLDRRHHLELIQAQMPCMGDPISRAGGTEDVGDLERGPHGSAGRRLAFHQCHQAVEWSGDRVDRPC